MSLKETLVTVTLERMGLHHGVMTKTKNCGKNRAELLVRGLTRCSRSYTEVCTT